jgi:hypothetical protein
MFRLVDPDGRLETDFEAGLALGSVRASGRGFANTYGGTRFEVGAHVAFESALRGASGDGPWVPLIGFEATFYPMVYDLDVMPRGVVSHTPSFWAGFTAGVGWGGK